MKTKNSYTYYNPVLRSLEYNEFPSAAVQIALGRAMSENPLPASALTSRGLYRENRTGSLVTASASATARPQTYASRGLVYSRDVTNQELSPREIRELGFDRAARNGGVANG